MELQWSQALAGLTSYGCHRDGTPRDDRCRAPIPFGMTRHTETLPMTTDTTALQREGIPDVGLGIGETFPDVVLPAVRDGQPMSLAAFRGEKLFLHLFASW